MILAQALPKKVGLIISAATKRVQIIHTFWGFEKPTHLAPNLHLTGPLLKEDSGDYVARLKTHHPELL